jgi:uncharacterized protein DUF3592
VKLLYDENLPPRLVESLGSMLFEDRSGKIFGFSPGTIILIAAGAIMLVGIGWQLVDTLIERFHGRNWPTVPAVIDIVSVAFIPDETPGMKASLDNSHYKATLTYTYNNPEQQMGEYSRDFGSEDDAKAWANSYKGETVKVHVDPRDPTRSVLREEDL